MSDLGPEPQQSDGGKGDTTVAIDFDGVLHAYTRGWHDGTIYDGPVIGAVEAVTMLADHYKVIVFTARRELDDIREWLARWDFPNGIEVTNHKPIAAVYIDDRAVRFHDWPQARRAIDMLLGSSRDPAAGSR